MPWNNFQPSAQFASPSFSSGGGVAELALAIAKQKEARAQQMAGAVAGMSQGLMKAYQGYKADKVANNLLQQRDPQAASQLKAAGLSGQQAYAQYQQDQQQKEWDDQGKRQDVKDWYQNQINNRTLWPEQYGIKPKTSGSATSQRDVETPYGVMTAFQWSNDPRNSDGIKKPAKPDSYTNTLQRGTALARGKLNDNGEFTSAYSEAATGPYAKVKTWDGKDRVVKWEDYDRAQSAKPAGVINPVTVKEGEPNPVVTVPDAVKKPESTNAPPASDSTKGKETAGVKVKHPDGRIGLIPRSQLQDALSQGFQQVQ